MDTQELIRKILQRLGRFKILIVLFGILLAFLLFLYARSIPAMYTVKSTLFPLNTSQEGSSASSRLSDIIGGGSNTKNLSDEANVSIEEVGRSKKTRLAVVSQRLPEYGNKMIAEVLINEYNKERSFLSPAIEIPKSDSAVMNIGVGLIANRYNIKFNKTGLLECYFSGPDQKLLIPVNYIMIDKVSQFYTELKTEKAKADYEFVRAKIDSFEQVIRMYDARRIRINKTTLFVPEDRLQYEIPKENLDNDKLRVMAQRNGAAGNREEALWRLQKVTPIIKLLDKPALDSVTKPSASTYAIAGFFIGCLLAAFLFIVGLIYRYAMQHVQAMVSGKKNEGAHMSTTA